MVTFACAWALFVNTMLLLSWLATQKPNSCTLPTQSAIQVCNAIVIRASDSIE